jgi:hypothetical protein
MEPANHGLKHLKLLAKNNPLSLELFSWVVPHNDKKLTHTTTGED